MGRALYGSERGGSCDGGRVSCREIVWAECVIGGGRGGACAFNSGRRLQVFREVAGGNGRCVCNFCCCSLLFFLSFLSGMKRCGRILLVVDEISARYLAVRNGRFVLWQSAVLSIVIGDGKTALCNALWNYIRATYERL